MVFAFYSGAGDRNGPTGLVDSRGQITLSRGDCFYLLFIQFIKFQNGIVLVLPTEPGNQFTPVNPVVPEVETTIDTSDITQMLFFTVADGYQRVYIFQSGFDGYNYTVIDRLGISIRGVGF